MAPGARCRSLRSITSPLPTVRRGSGRKQITSLEGHPIAKNLSPSRIEHLLSPYIDTPPSKLVEQLTQYLDLLLHWNARTNLTAIRDPEAIVQRHFGESLFAARHLSSTGTLLDFGSGAGFPGLPIALFHPNLIVTLAESQHKKSSFLREVVRHLDLLTEVWPSRVEQMPPTRRFDTVTLRAVDRMDQAIAAASPRTSNTLLLLTTLARVPNPNAIPNFDEKSSQPIPNAADGILLQLVRR